MRKRKLLFIAICILLTLAVSLSACDFFNGNNNGDNKDNDNNSGNMGNPDPDKDKIVLDIPEVSVNADGLATWTKVDNAVGYKYKIDGGMTMVATADSVQLQNNQYIQVKAVGSGNYTDSAFSEPKYYKVLTDCNEHIDLDDDGECDNCRQDVMMNLSFLAINDLHGRIADSQTQTGVDELTTYLKTLYADNESEEILISSGDMWQGTVESSLNRGALMTEWMNEVGFSSMTLGNHEFDWGVSYVTRNSKKADFDFLGINVRYNGQKLEGVKSSTVVEKGGVKIGIIGAIGNCVSSISGEFNSNLNFISGDALTELVKEESTRLRNEENCKFIVYSLHSGMSGISSKTSVDQSDLYDEKGMIYDETLSNGYIDLVFEGHTHQSYVVEDSYGVYHVQGGAENRYISVSSVALNTANGKSSVSVELLSSSYYSDGYESDPIVDELFTKYFPDQNPYTTVVGELYSNVSSSVICNKVAEYYYRVGVERWGKSYDVILGGGFLSLRNPYYLRAGNVTYADLFSILPFDNTIVLGKISGTKLKSQFLNTTNDRYYSYYTEDLKNTVKDNEYYYIIVDTYTSYYRYNGITEIARYDDGVYARDLLANDFPWGKKA